MPDTKSWLDVSTVRYAEIHRVWFSKYRDKRVYGTVCLEVQDRPAVLTCTTETHSPLLSAAENIQATVAIQV